MTTCAFHNPSASDPVVNVTRPVVELIENPVGWVSPAAPNCAADARLNVRGLASGSVAGTKKVFTAFDFTVTIGGSEVAGGWFTTPVAGMTTLVSTRHGKSPLLCSGPAGGADSRF